MPRGCPSHLGEFASFEVDGSILFKIEFQFIVQDGTIIFIRGREIFLLLVVLVICKARG
jgi:hypothetical protein